VVLFNLKLQILRGDLGLPFFPGKDLHNNWLCKALPVYHVRPVGRPSLLYPPNIAMLRGVLSPASPGVPSRRRTGMSTCVCVHVSAP